ncbi:AAA family ATPase [Actinocrinis puniceicyclus]|uniref:AAA family ATPase n=1 Tax=Actinocrinis puniceicyclus TaxID=977794 RepID=A0A8J7WR34_9ACTN|nr:LuxR family transcriptional regulator [Actinocrinis puniceicyclus]MBS2963990.1 AAA family ATPase [Actinocrinis puniceicyclus]
MSTLVRPVAIRVAHGRGPLLAPSPQQIADPPLGRDELLRQARERLRQGPGALLYGPAGIGKSRVLTALAAEAAGAGVRVLRCTPAEAELRLPFVCLIDLLGPIPDETIARLPGGMGTALRAALLRGTVPHSDQDRLKVQLAVLHLLRELSARAPVWLVIDDLQWVDRPTAQVLGFVARRMADLPVRVLAAERAPEGGSPAYTDLVPPDIAEFAVAPLALADLAAVLDRYTGTKLPPATVRQIHRAAGGNPFYALELARALPPDQCALAPGELLPIPSRLRAVLLRRLRELPDPTRSVLLLASTADRPTLTLLGKVDGEADFAHHLAVAERLGVIRVCADGLIQFEHPLVRAAVYADASSKARRAAHADLAAAVVEPVERARHLALAHPAENEQVAATLAEAAASARRRGAPATAAELAALAAQRTPCDEGTLRTERLLAAAEYACDAALRGEARRLAEQVLGHSASPAHRTEARILLLRCAGNSLGGVTPIIAQGLSEVAGDPGLEAKLRCWSARVELVVGHVTAAAAFAREAAELARRAGDPATEISALTTLAHSHGLTGDPAGRAALRQAFELAARNPAAAGGPAGLWEPVRREALYDMQADRLENAERKVVALLDRAGDAIGVEDLCTILITQTDIRVRAGACRDATQSAQRALRLLEDLSDSCGPVLFAAALAETAGGTLERALSYAEAGIAASRADGDQHGLVRNLAVLGRVHLLADEPARALEPLREAEQIERRIGISDPASGNWHADLAEALVAVGETAQAADLVAVVSRQARQLGRRGVLTALERSDALRLAALGNLAEAAARLRAVAEQQGDLPLERVRTLLALAQVERRRRHPGAARDALAEAQRLAEAAGATLWAKKVERERGRLGDPVAQAVGGADNAALTGAERRCAELAAAGATNREIAAALFVSVKTVEATLSRSYRKLGVRSRTQLARMLADAAPAPSARLRAS